MDKTTTGRLLPIRPRLHPSYYVVTMGADKLQLRNDERVILVEGQNVSSMFKNLIPLLDGSLTVSEIVERLVDVNEEDIMDTLRKLNHFRVLEDTSGEPPDEMTSNERKLYDMHLTLFSQFDLNKYDVQKILKNSKVVIMPSGGMGSQIAIMLASSGVGHIVVIDPNTLNHQDLLVNKMFSEDDIGKNRAEIVKMMCARINPYVTLDIQTEPIDSREKILPLLKGSDLVIVAEDKFCPNIYDLVNQACIDLGVKWTSCQCRGLKGFIGPTIVPKQTACYKCFESRLNSNMQFYRESEAFKEYISSEHVYKEYGKLIMFYGIIGNIMAMEVIKILTRIVSSVTLSRQMIFDFVSMDLEFHDILRLPRCSSCGVSSNMTPRISYWSEQ